MTGLILRDSRPRKFPGISPKPSETFPEISYHPWGTAIPPLPITYNFQSVFSILHFSSDSAGFPAPLHVSSEYECAYFHTNQCKPAGVSTKLSSEWYCGTHRKNACAKFCPLYYKPSRHASHERN